MAKPINRLPPKAVETLGEGCHSDGGGLYFLNKGGRRSWIFRFKWNGRGREMGLGSAATVTLAKARKAAADARATIADGRNPLDDRREAKTIPTFGEMADTVVADLSPGWRNEKHKAQWASTLKTHGKKLRAIPVDRVSTADVLAVLKPIWSKLPETASRFRGRIERVLDAAKAKGFRTGENPARWRGHLDQLLPKRQKLTRGHHKAMPFADVPAFIADLRERDAVSALALEFTIFTAARSGEVRGATWAEVDLANAVWTIPASRMKAGREHRVPLSAAAMAVLKKVKPLSSGEPEALIFPGTKSDKALSDAAFNALLIRMNRKGEFTPHGFRSSFRDWAGEVSPFPRELAEAALAHVVGDATERAYRRGDALEKRRKLMEAWAGFCEQKTDHGTVVSLKRTQ